ncbi:MAG: Vibrio phage pVp [Bacteroidota bacterium]|jgi:DNA polymerase-1
MKTFKEFESTEKTLMIVDALNLAFRYKHSGARNFAEDYLRTVQSLAKSYKAQNVLIAADQGSSSYRKAIYPLYKQNRKDKYDQQTEAERIEFELFFEDFTKTLELLGDNYPVLRFQGVEADDIAAYIVNKKRKLPLDQIWLMSSDKDWDLLIKPGVGRFSYVTRKEVTWDNWNDHYAFEPEQYISVKCLMGDSGDNVPGVPGVGPKRAQQLVEEYGTTWDIINSIPLSGKYKYIEAINQSKEQLELNYQLMDLQTYCTDAIGSENCKQIDEILELTIK